ncbi:MAG: hypothetical protein ACREQR_18730 [Candidatus Binataceae bacterium]
MAELFSLMLGSDLWKIDSMGISRQIDVTFPGAWMPPRVSLKRRMRFFFAAILRRQCACNPSKNGGPKNRNEANAEKRFVSIREDFLDVSGARAP